MDSVIPFIGIDFGTSKSSMAWYDHRIGRADIILNAEGKQITPSAVYLGPTDSETLVGDPAERKLGQEKVDQRRFVFSVKRDLMRAPTKVLDGKAYSPVKVASLILAKLREDADKRHFKQPVDRVVIAHPASFNTLQQDKIKEAALLAGFSQVELLSEPVAAALAYAYTGLKVGQYIMVYDFGGGTFDVAVLQRISDGTFRRALASRGLPKCGGDDLDRAVYKYCEEIVQREKERQISLTDEYDLRFLRLCRECKENLTSQGDYTFSNYLPSNNGRVLFEHTLDRSAFESRVRDYISQTVTLTQEVMREANGKGCQVDTVVLIGGSSRVPLVWHSLVESLPVKLDEWHYQDIAVALGAAYHAQQLWGTQSSSGVYPSELEEEYGTTVKDASANNISSETKINEVTAKAHPLEWGSDEAAGIEGKIIGGTKEELLKHPQTPTPRLRSSSKRTGAWVAGILVVLLIIISLGLGLSANSQQQQNTQATATAQSDQATQDAINIQQTQDAQATQDAINIQQTQDAQATQTAAASFPNVQGNYSGNYQNTTISDSGTISLNINQENGSISGTCTLNSSNFTINNGTVDQSGDITFTIDASLNGTSTTVTFNGTSQSGGGWQGTFTDTIGNSGTWNAI